MFIAFMSRPGMKGFFYWGNGEIIPGSNRKYMQKKVAAMSKVHFAAILTFRWRQIHSD
jgi:hypothetical protein